MNWRVIWKSLGDRDMRNRILAVLGMLLVFRILAHIPIPIGSPETLKQVLESIYTSSKSSSLLSFIDVLSGGALANFSIMLIGLGPYINASIIMQLLTKAIPQLETLNNEGEYGRKKINQYTRILALPLAIVQSIGAIYLVRQSASSLGGIDITANTSPIHWVVMVASLTGASMLLMWLGELITEEGIGNGISLIITVGIVSRLPAAITQLIASASSAGHKYVLFGGHLVIYSKQLIYIAGALVAISAITVAVVKLNEAARNITVHYAKRIQGNRTYGGVTTTLPVKLITAGVVPIIFAVAFLSVPSFAGQILKGQHSASLQHWGGNLIQWFQNPSSTTFAAPGWTPYIYPGVYFLLVFVFTFFYTSITFNTKEIAENLQKQGGFIEGIRSGAQTEKYLGKIVNRLTFFGALSLGLLALLPIFAQAFLSTNVALSGTSILILVAVALETLRQIESRALMVTYDQYEQPDFFYDVNDNPVIAATGARKLKFGLPYGRQRSKKAKRE
ncbi:MAG: preprotein translocase subunit SecY [Candidatus Saccharibacteria bacterium]